MVTLKKVTVIAEAVLEPRLIKDLRSLGARGYTITDVRGEGSRGVRAGDPEGRNVQIDVLATQEVADRIVTHITDRYFRHYAVVAYVTDVGVVRGDKYI